MLEYIRSHKILGMAVFDLAGSMIVSSVIGGRFGANALFSGLISIPISVVSHILFGVDTELTRFYRSDSPHKYHGAYLGTIAGVTSKMFGYSTISSANIGLIFGIVSTMYMKEYGHGLPPKLNRKLLRYYMKYQRWKST